MQVRYENGFLRGFAVDGAEVLRMIYFAIRDRHWQTARITVTDEVIDQTADSFRIQYQWSVDDLGIQMTGRVVIVGTSDGAVSFDFYGEALNQFAKNRVGICVLHPLKGVTGQPCQIDNPHEQRTTGHFPAYISPHQPFIDIQTLHWQPVSGHALRLDFTGDVFEMEDQRNWTDASFKTYSTPLSLPFPATMEPRQTVQQRVVFRIDATKQVAPTQQLTADIHVHKTPEQVYQTTKLPRIGIGQRADGQPLGPAEAMRLRELPLAHLRADVLLTTGDWSIRLTNAIADAHWLRVPLELALFFGDNPTDDLTALLNFMTTTNVGIDTVLIFSTDTLRSSDALLHQVAAPLRAAWPTVLIGGGTDSAFVDVNRNPFDYSLVDFVVYSMNPQVHAFDDRTLLENVDGQRPTVQTARHLTGGKPVHISPVTLLPRYPPITESITTRLSPPTDARQSTDFAADWTRLSLEALTSAGVESVTYYETHGPRGLVDGDVSFPVFDALKERMIEGG